MSEVTVGEERQGMAEKGGPQRGGRRDADATSGNIWGRVLLYVLPLMAASLFQQLYTVVDAAIVGNFVGSVALGAIDSTNSNRLLA